MSRDLPSQDTIAILERGFPLFRGVATDRGEAEAARRNNGYADLTIRSAKEAVHLLQLRGAELPHVPGINNQAGTDPNPGYNLILAIDSEGNLINFSQYPEY